MLKIVVLEVEEFIRAMTKLFIERRTDRKPGKKRVGFILLPTMGMNVISPSRSYREPLGSAIGNKRKDTQFPEILVDKRKKLRSEKLCFIYKKAGYYTSQYPGKETPSRS